MSNEPDFKGYLKSKKIDTEAFAKAEPEMWSSWKSEFEQMHPNSFTVQKLNLINPVRRKYPLKEAEGPARPAEGAAPPSGTPKPVSPQTGTPKPGRPVIKPRPKIG